MRFEIIIRSCTYEPIKEESKYAQGIRILRKYFANLFCHRSKSFPRTRSSTLSSKASPTRLPRLRDFANRALPAKATIIDQATRSPYSIDLTRPRGSSIGFWRARYLDLLPQLVSQKPASTDSSFGDRSSVGGSSGETKPPKNKSQIRNALLRTICLRMDRKTRRISSVTQSLDCESYALAHQSREDYTAPVLARKV